MFDFIKDIFRRKYLRKAASAAGTGLYPLQDIKSVSIIIDTEEQGSDECKEKATAFFKTHGIRTSVYFFDFSKKGEDERQTTSLNNTILRGDLNWCGRPSAEKMSMLVQENSDMLLSLVDNAEFPIEYMAKCSPSRFKIGRRQLKGRTFDLVVEDSPTQIYTPLQAFNEITRYLDTIKQ